MNRTRLLTIYVYISKCSPSETKNSSYLSNNLQQLGYPLMGGQSGDSTMASSSIALLQERFRQLERVREKREEKDLLKLFSDSDQAALAMRVDSTKSSFQPEMILPHNHGPALQNHSLSLGLNSQGKHADFQATPSPAAGSLWPNGVATPSTSRNFDHSDVDTSLHL